MAHHRRLPGRMVLHLRNQDHPRNGSRQRTITATTSNPEQPPSSLLDLPPSIRKSIYTHLFAGGSFDGSLSSLGYPALLATDKQIRKEAFPIYFRETTFYSSYKALLKMFKWLKRVPMEHRACIRSFEVFESPHDRTGRPDVQPPPVVEQWEELLLCRAKEGKEVLKREGVRLGTGGLEMRCCRSCEGGLKVRV